MSINSLILFVVGDGASIIETQERIEIITHEHVHMHTHVHTWAYTYKQQQYI